MVTSYGIRLILAICFALSFGALIINTNIMLSVHSVISKKRLSSLFHDELQHVLVDFNGAFIHQNSKLSSNLNLPFSHFPQHTVDFDFDTSDNSDISPFLYKKNFTPSLVLGHGPSAPVSFVIGIPSIKRSGVSYLYATLTSLFRNMYPVNENKTLVVVFLAETDSNYVNATMSEIYQNFTREVDMGFLQVISPPENLYPSFNLPQTLGDPMDRLRWRSKEVFDAAYLMFVCRNRADYYLMLEDDVIALRGFVQSMKKTLSQYGDADFGYISFSTFNSIGKLFRRTDVPKWASFFFTFYGTKPIDWLMIDVMKIQSCHPEMSASNCEIAMRKRIPQSQKGLFQHIGKMSSLAGKQQLITDKKFSSQAIEPNPHVNLPAKVDSTFKPADSSRVTSLYEDSGGMTHHFFVEGADADNVINVEFSKSSYVFQILVKTGNSDGDFRLCRQCGVLEISNENVKTSSQPYKTCAAFDKHGSAQCLINRSISSFRIRTTIPVHQKIWFDLVYVQ